MVLIGLHGRKSSGKDSAFQAISEWSSGRGFFASRAGFADKLKLSAYRCFHPEPEYENLPGTELERAIQWADYIKREPSLHPAFQTNMVTYSLEHESGKTGKGITGREFLQNYGTEAHREVFGSEFWVDALLPRGYVSPVGPKWWSSFDEQADIAVITDVRFENEAGRIKEFGGVIWYIDRPEVEEGDQHASEQLLPESMIDKTVRNDSSLDEFLIRVNAEMTYDYERQFATYDPTQETA